MEPVSDAIVPREVVKDVLSRMSVEKLANAEIQLMQAEEPYLSRLVDAAVASVLAWLQSEGLNPAMSEEIARLVGIAMVYRFVGMRLGHARLWGKKCRIAMGKVALWKRRRKGTRVKVLTSVRSDVA